MIKQNSLWQLLNDGNGYELFLVHEVIVDARDVERCMVIFSQIGQELKYAAGLEEFERAYGQFNLHEWQKIEK